MITCVEINQIYMYNFIVEGTDGIGRCKSNCHAIVGRTGLRRCGHNCSLDNMQCVVVCTCTIECGAELA